ncbi:MAG: zinc metallopeptidase [Synergistaceae bacterium]|jgi:Zn-dependent membrane protease YugP|nr:zinc metallopeptidase [Synergistaceae bacterium]
MMLPYFFDPTMILLLPALLLAGWAQLRVKSTFERYSHVGTRRGMTADRVARMLLDRFGLTSVSVKRVAGQLTDHYDPRDKSLSLSDSVYGNASIAAIGVAAHEVGHAIQNSVGYVPLGIRNNLVPVVNLGSFMAMPLFFIGFLFRGSLWMNIGIFLFLGVVIFHLVTLPVEFNASSRAVAILEQTGALSGDELQGAGSVLNAAAWTYVAATLMAVMQLLRLLALAALRRDSRD